MSIKVIPPTRLASAELQEIVRKLAPAIATELSLEPKQSVFIRSSECASILGITPEHLCAMRARGEGPPWSGEGRWIRYERSVVLDWIRDLPKTSDTNPSPDLRRTDPENVRNGTDSATQNNATARSADNGESNND